MSDTVEVRIDSIDLAGIQRLAQTLLANLETPLAIGLVGTLGAGKTTFVQAIASAAGVDTADVTSPTFTLLQSHQGSITIHHLDAYRLADEDEFLELGVDELFDDPDSCTLVEWADRVESVMPIDTLWIEIRIGANDDRLVCLTGPVRMPNLLDAIQNQF